MIFVIVAKMETKKEDDKRLLLEVFDNMKCSVITKKYNTTCSQPTEMIISGFSVCSHCFEKMMDKKVAFIEIPINIDADTLGKGVFMKEI